MLKAKEDGLKLFRGGEKSVLSARNREEIKVFFASGASQKKTDISKVNQQTVVETEARFKKIMSSKKASVTKGSSSSSSSAESMRSKTTVTAIARAINKRLGLTVFFCEMVGAFLVELFACLTKRPEDAFGVVALAMGLLNLLFQDVSGAQFHPYLTVARWFVSTNNRWLTMIQENKVHKRAIVTSSISGAFVIVAQFVGVLSATFVAVALRGMLPRQEPADAVQWVVFVVELVCFLCIALVSISTNKTLYLFRPFYIVLVWYAVGFVANPYSGAVLNPYRWLAVSLVSQQPDWIFAWAYFLGPLAGLLCAMQLFSVCKL